VRYFAGAVSTIDTRTRRVVGAPIPVGVLPLAAAVSLDGQKLYVANSSNSSVSVIDATTSKVV
jgi:DNA-binding beta-propeller fold protein YncE